MQYRLIAWSAAAPLNEEINKYLKEGWEPHGSPIISFDPQPIFAQAIIKKD